MEISGDVFNNVYVDKKEIQFFDYILNAAKEHKSYMFIAESFEEYYFILKETISFYEGIDMYENCAIVKKYLNSFLELIPKNLNEALDYLIELTPEKVVKDFDNLEEVDDFSFALDFHFSVGKTLIDWWLLKHPISPLVEYYKKEYDMKNADRICHDILLKYVSIAKAKFKP